MLLAIGASSVSFARNPRLSEKFTRVAGILVLFFALYNVNSQLNVLGLPSLNDLGFRSNPSITIQNEKGLAPIVNGKQIISMEASAYGYSPNSFKVRAGVPVRWEVKDIGTSGCTSAIISRSLFDG